MSASPGAGAALAYLLLRCQFRAHPRVNTALELGRCSARHDGATSRRTVLGLARLHEYVARAWGFWDETTKRSRGAFGRRDGIARQRIEGRNEAAAELFDLRKGVCLSGPVLQ